jgi:hypothetical protein
MIRIKIYYYNYYYVNIFYKTKIMPEFKKITTSFTEQIGV